MQHVSMRPGATFFLPDTRGVEMHLHGHGITGLVIAGTHMCVDTTTRAATDLGFGCHLAHDACATRSLSFGGATVAAADVQTAYMASLNGLFAKVQSASEVCSGL